jgi:prophage tail gpP-like protein
MSCIWIRGRALHGWDRIRITRGIERMPSDFDISIMDYYPGDDQQQLVSPGDPCVVKLGKDVVITGYVDRWCPSIRPNQHQIRVTGRGNVRTWLIVRRSGKVML